MKLHIIKQVFSGMYLIKSSMNYFFFDQDPKMYVQTILDVHKKYHALVMTAFSNDAGFVAALDKVRQANLCQLPYRKSTCLKFN